MHKYGCRVNVRARGEVVTLEFGLEIARIRHTPMDESKGEGWHRETNYEAARSNNAGDALLLSVPRHKQNLKTCVNFVNNQPEFSQKVFRYEWQNVKRIIRPSAFDRWKSVKVTDREFYERLYRLTDDADDWAKLLGIAAASVGGSGGGGRDDNGGVGQARQDYLRKVSTPDAFFSVPVTQTGVDDCGAVREITKDAHFQILIRSMVPAAQKFSTPSEMTIKIQLANQHWQYRYNTLVFGDEVRQQKSLASSKRMHNL